MIVADTNLIAYLLIDGVHTELAERVLTKDPEWIAPLLWRSELRQVLSKSVRAGMPDDKARRAMDLAKILLAGREFAVPSKEVFDLAFSTPCSAYDCEFVVLAQAERIPLVTSDRQLRNTFPDIAVEPASFVEA